MAKNRVEPLKTPVFWDAHPFRFPLPILSVPTLVLPLYQGGGFIPYERHPAAHRIRSIAYTSRLYYHGQHDLRVAIDSTGLARYSYRSGTAEDTIGFTRHG